MMTMVEAAATGPGFSAPLGTNGVPKLVVVLLDDQCLHHSKRDRAARPTRAGETRRASNGLLRRTAPVRRRPAPRRLCARGPVLCRAGARRLTGSPRRGESGRGRPMNATPGQRRRRSVARPGRRLCGSAGARSLRRGGAPRTKEEHASGVAQEVVEGAGHARSATGAGAARGVAAVRWSGCATSS